MKRECEIVQDLLFGYQDGTLHNESKELVENHLISCEQCKKLFNEMKKDKIDNKKEQEEEIDYLKKVKKKINKKNKWIIIIGIILGIIILFNIFIFTYYYSEAGKVKIYLSDNITEEQKENIEKSVTNIDGEAEIKYYSKEDSLNQMKEKFKDREELLSGYNKDNNPLPAYFVVDTEIENGEKIKNTVESLEGVEHINNIGDTNPYMFMLSEIIVEFNSN